MKISKYLVFFPKKLDIEEEYGEIFNIDAIKITYTEHPYHSKTNHYTFEKDKVFKLIGKKIKESIKNNLVNNTFENIKILSDFDCHRYYEGHVMFSDRELFLAGIKDILIRVQEIFGDRLFKLIFSDDDKYFNTFYYYDNSTPKFNINLISRVLYNFNVRVNAKKYYKQLLNMFPNHNTIILQFDNDSIEKKENDNIFNRSDERCLLEINYPNNTNIWSNTNYIKALTDDKIDINNFDIYNRFLNEANKYIK